MTERVFEPKATSRFRRVNEPPAGGSRRWQKRASRLGRAFEVGGLALFAGAAGYVFRGNHPIVIGLLILTFVPLAIQLLSRSGIYELVIDDKQVHWGWAGVRSKDASFLYNFLSAARFHQRSDGTGAIEFVFENGTSLIAPSEFTDLPGVSEEILTTLKSFLPDLEITVS